MNWISRLERRFPRFGIPNLMLYVVLGQLICWIGVMFVNANLYGLLTLSRARLLEGQIWRLVTFLLVPPLQYNPLFVALELYFLYWIGSALERVWGSFRFTLYVALGIVGAWLACLVVGAANTSGLSYSLFFAFAYLFPNMEVLLFFVLPVKIKWLGWIAAALYLVDFLLASLPMKLALVLGLLGFLVFFGRGGIQRLKDSYTNYQRRKAWQNQWRQ